MPDFSPSPPLISLASRGLTVAAVAACHFAAIAAIAGRPAPSSPQPILLPVRVELLPPAVAPAPDPMPEPATLRVRPAPRPPPLSAPTRAARTPERFVPSPIRAADAPAPAAAQPPAPEPAPSALARVVPPEPPPLAAPASVQAQPIEPPARLPLHPPSFDAAYLANPKPHYPLAARRHGLEGTVMVHVEVSRSGEPDSLRVASSSGSAQLDRAALAAVERWRFIPARLGEEHVASAIEVPIVFKLEN